MFENVLGTLAMNDYGVIKREILCGREENSVDKMDVNKLATQSC
jgi:hypothetical protein